MKLDDSDINLAEELADSIDDEHVSQGKPETSYKSDIDDEQWYRSMVEATLREAIRELHKAYVNLPVDERGDEPSADDLLAGCVERIYVSQYPWRPPFMAIELEECPEWAQMTVIKEGKVRTHPAHSLENTAVYFQVRESL